jgi:hypothetical protein
MFHLYHLIRIVAINKLHCLAYRQLHKMTYIHMKLLHLSPCQFPTYLYMLGNSETSLMPFFLFISYASSCVYHYYTI